MDKPHNPQRPEAVQILPPQTDKDTPKTAHHTGCVHMHAKKIMAAQQLIG